MSQLNNKNNTAKKTFFMLLIFAVVCTGFTAVLIHNTINSRQEYSDNMTFENNISLDNTINIEQEETPVKESTVEKVNLTDKYFTNGITTEQREISFGDIVYQYGSNIERKLEINYVQISGLKNTTIEDKINKEIENQALSFRNDDELNDSGIQRIGIYANVFGSFSDVLSVSITKNITRRINEEYEYEYETIGLNYSLKDGEKIKFNDLFTEDAAIKNIITQSVYDNLAWNYASESGNLDADMSKLDYRDIEDRIFKILSNYRRNPDLTFYFSPSIISFIDDNIVYSIPMDVFYDSIAIYTRYKSHNNLYKDESLVNDINYVFSKADMSECTEDISTKTDNFQYRIIKYSSDNEKDDNIQKAENAVKDELYEKINEYAVLANKNKQKGYIFDVIYYIFEHDGKAGYNYTGYLCSMDRKFYDDDLEEVIAASMRKEMVELGANDYSYIDQDNITFEEQISVYVNDYTNPIAEEQIITKEDREKIYEENGY